MMAWGQARLALEAIRNDDLAKIEKLEPSQIDLRDRQGATLLMHAAGFGSPAAMRLLLDRKADVNAVNAFNSSALHWAAGDPVKTKLLVEHGAKVAVVSKYGRTPLMLAAVRGGNSPIVRLLIEKGADVKTADNRGVTALHEAAQSGDLTSMRLLIEHGADVNALDRNGDSPLMFAAAGLHSDGVQLLLKHGANVNVVRRAYPSVKHGQVEQRGVTALLLAVPYASAGLTQILIKAGADVRAQDARGMSALMMAVATERQDPGVVRALLAAGADVHAKSKLGETALDWALKFGNPATIAVLRDAGAITGVTRDKVAEPKPRADLKPEAAATQSLKLMQKSTAEFFAQSGCVGCHHQPATAHAVQIAQRAKLPYDESLAKQNAEMLRLGWGLSPDEMIQGIVRGGGTDRLIDHMLGSHAAGNPPDEWSEAALCAVASMQRPDGSWFDAPAPRPPLAEGLISRTAYGIQAFRTLGWRGRRAEFEERILRARDFLLKSKAATGDDRAMKLLGLVWASAPEERIREAALDLVAHQRKDGGWSGNEHLASDAFTTGQSLVALRESARITGKNNAAYQKGVAYLLRTQYPDGSWHVSSRALKFQPYFQSGFPFDHDQWISITATSWAAQALMMNP